MRTGMLYAKSNSPTFMRFAGKARRSMTFPGSVTHRAWLEALNRPSYYAAGQEHIAMDCVGCGSAAVTEETMAEDRHRIACVQVNVARANPPQLACGIAMTQASLPW
jgi:hypothetical protein